MRAKFLQMKKKLSDQLALQKNQHQHQDQHHQQESAATGGAVFVKVTPKKEGGYEAEIVTGSQQSV